MSRRTLLSAEQRARLFAVPTDPAEMARHYVLGDEDLALIRAKRRGMNRLGFAVQLCLLRYPGQGLGTGDQPPAAMIAFVADQVGIHPVRLSRLVEEGAIMSAQHITDLEPARRTAILVAQVAAKCATKRRAVLTAAAARSGETTESGPVS